MACRWAGEVTSHTQVSEPTGCNRQECEGGNQSNSEVAAMFHPHLAHDAQLAKKDSKKKD